MGCSWIRPWRKPHTWGLPQTLKSWSSEKGRALQATTHVERPPFIGRKHGTSMAELNNYNHRKYWVQQIFGAWDSGALKLSFQNSCWRLMFVFGSLLLILIRSAIFSEIRIVHFFRSATNLPTLKGLGCFERRLALRNPQAWFLNRTLMCLLFDNWFVDAWEKCGSACKIGKFFVWCQIDA